MLLQIGTYSALIGDQALFCSSKMSKLPAPAPAASPNTYIIESDDDSLHAFYGVYVPMGNRSLCHGSKAAFMRLLRCRDLSCSVSLSQMHIRQASPPAKHLQTITIAHQPCQKFSHSLSQSHTSHARNILSLSQLHTRHACPSCQTLPPAMSQ